MLTLQRATIITPHMWEGGLSIETSTDSTLFFRTANSKNCKLSNFVTVDFGKLDQKIWENLQTVRAIHFY